VARSGSVTWTRALAIRAAIAAVHRLGGRDVRSSENTDGVREELLTRITRSAGLAWRPHPSAVSRILPVTMGVHPGRHALSAWYVFCAIGDADRRNDLRSVRGGEKAWQRQQYIRQA